MKSFILIAVEIVSPETWRKAIHQRINCKLLVPAPFASGHRLVFQEDYQLCTPSDNVTWRLTMRLFPVQP